MLAMTPPFSALTSRSIFSVSSSTTASPTSTRSPSFFSQRATRASTTDSPSSGTTMFVTCLPLGARQAPHLLGEDHRAVGAIGRRGRRMAVEIVSLLHEYFLVQLMPRRRSFRRARAAGAADVAERAAIADHLLEQRAHEFPGAHVLGLFLQP